MRQSREEHQVLLLVSHHVGKATSPLGSKPAVTHFLALPYETFVLGEVRPWLATPLQDKAEQP